MKQIIFIAMTLLAVQAHSRTCSDLFNKPTKVTLSVNSPEVLHHVVRPDDRTYTDRDFIDLLYSVTQSKKDLQNWPLNSQGGQIWTAANGHNDLTTNGFSVYFTMKKNYLFYDKRGDHRSLWEKWWSENKHRKNNFPRVQRILLKKAGDPWHSGFYKDHKFAGLLSRYGFNNDLSAQNDLARNAYNIVNMESIKEILVKKEYDIILPENHKLKYVPTIYNQKTHHFVLD